VSNADDPAAMTVALGKYLTGLSVESGGTDYTLINSARALWGDPPVAGASGYPPAIRVQPSGGQTNPPVPTPPAPTVSNLTRTGVTLSIPAIAGATLYEWVKNGGDHAHTSTPSYTDKSVAPGARYVYAVYAKLASGATPTSPQTVVTIPK
jgi:hypothetical protein